MFQIYFRHRSDIASLINKKAMPREATSNHIDDAGIFIASKEASNRIKHNLRKQGFTLKSWAAANNFKYRDVSDVVRGIRQGNYGTGRDIAQKLKEYEAAAA